METREHITYKLQPSQDSPDNGPMTGFNLVRTQVIETRRSSRDAWHADYSHPPIRTTVATFTRAQLAEHVADAADALAWLGD